MFPFWVYVQDSRSKLDVNCKYNVWSPATTLINGALPKGHMSREVKNHHIMLNDLRKLLLSILLFGVASGSINAQAVSNDTITKLSGDRIAVKIVSTSENNVTYSYPGETMTISMSKNLIEEIKYASGRKEKLKEKIVIRGEDDWEKVKLTTQTTDIEGLIKKGDLNETSPNIGIYTPARKAEPKIDKKIRQKAASLGAHIILITSPFTATGGNLYMMGGVAYGYK